MNEKEEYYLNLRKKIFNWAEQKGLKNKKILGYVLLAPDFFYLLWKLSLDKDIPGEDKILIGIALFYFISPFDLLPEVIMGPVGFIDDVAIAAYVTKKIIKNAGEEKVKQYWPGEEGLIETIEKVLTKTDELIGSGLWKRIIKLIEKKSEKETQRKKSSSSKSTKSTKSKTSSKSTKKSTSKK